MLYYSLIYNDLNLSDNRENDKYVVTTIHPKILKHCRHIFIMCK